MIMAGLAFQAILATGSRALGDAKGPGGEGIFDVFFENIDLPGFVASPALLVLSARNVDLENNFITINAPPEVKYQSFDEANSAGYFVWRVLPNPSDTWILQVHQVGSEKLRATGNVLGIHTRNTKGEQARVRDSFSVARLFIVYSSE
jgi:hypothetical protein